jgi:uncharacterized membrane protein YqaE (UPF0057 family)
MKSNTLFTIFSITALLAQVLLQGCATSNDVISDRGIQKRKYRSGYYVSNRSSKTNNGARTSEAESAQTPAHTALVSTPTPTATDASELVGHQFGSESYGAVFIAPQPSVFTTEAQFNRPLNVVQVSDAIQAAAHPAVQAENQNTLPAILAEKQNSKDDAELLIMIALCILLPPLAVFLLHGISNQFWISVLLTIVFWVPGIIYALYLTFMAH